jgi:hypothetical protein
LATFLVFEPAGSERTQESAERVIFLRERFSPWAFIFTPFWLLRHRLWLGFALWLVVFVAISLVGNALGFGPYAGVAASFFPALIFGLEATSLQARKLVKKGYREVAAVIADDIETAERRYFETWRYKSPVAPVKTDVPYPPQSAPPAEPRTQLASSGENQVVGLFPTPGGPR